MRFLVCFALLFATPTWADGLMGRFITFRVVTYDDPADILYESRTHGVTVVTGPELGLQREGTPDLDLIPVIIDVSERRVTLDYRNADPGPFFKAQFNGYILDFGTGCPSVVAALVDPDGTTLAISNKRVDVADGRLSINVSGLTQTRDSRIAIDLTLTPCET